MLQPNSSLPLSAEPDTNQNIVEYLAPPSNLGSLASSPSAVTAVNSDSVPSLSHNLLGSTDSVDSGLSQQDEETNGSLSDENSKKKSESVSLLLRSHA
jgi:hypothetical protein